MMASARLKGLKPRPKTGWKRVTRLVGAAVLCSSFLGVPRPQAQAQTVAATVTEILDSNQVYIQNRTAQINSVAQQRQQVRTQAARTSLRFNNGAVARLAHNSSLVVGQCAQMNRGTLLVNGTLNGCSTSTVAGVRGTIYTLEVTEAGQTIIQVFEGEVVVQRNLNPEPVDPLLNGEDFNPVDPTLDPVVPSVDPVVPFVNPGEPPVDPAPTPVEPPAPSPEPPIAPPVSPDPTPAGPLEPPVNPTGPPTAPIPGPLGFLAAPKQSSSSPADPGLADPGPADTGDPAMGLPADPHQEGTVEFTPANAITVAQGQQVTINAERNEAVIAFLTSEDFLALLEGPLMNGFALEIPGMGSLRSTFEQLFPGVPLPSYWVPPIPSPPIRFPFPF